MTPDTTLTTQVAAIEAALEKAIERPQGQGGGIWFDRLDHLKAYDKACHPEAIRSILAALKAAQAGHTRYETVRKMNPRQFADVWEKALNGQRFDDLIDAIAASTGAKP